MCVATDEPKRAKGMNKEIAIVTGLGFGEEAKGGTVEWLTRKLNAHTILRSGGCQSGHQITLENGTEHQFTHFSAGTFEGAKTHLVNMVISPVDLFNEAIELESKGVKSPFSLITIDENCLSITPYHSAISRFREIMRGKDKKGTVGKGVGEAVRDSSNPNISIRAGEFFASNRELKQKVENIRIAKLNVALEILSKNGGNMPEEAKIELDLLKNKDLVGLTVDSFRYIANLVDIVGDKYFKDLLSLNGNIVNEPDHGVLHHPWYGFVPHVTQVDPTSESLIANIKKSHYDGKLFRIGVTRAYMTRHGAGPLVSYSPNFTRSIKETHNNKAEDNAWLGEFRSGYFDTVALNYAIEVSGGKDSYGGLNLSYMDELAKASEWGVCTAYKYEGKEYDIEKFFVVENGLVTAIKAHQNTRDVNHLNHQIKLTQMLKDCVPVVTTLQPQENKELSEVFMDFVEDSLGIPVVSTSSGPKASDKSIRKGHEDLFTA